jgi:hypothetical protein
MLSWFTHIIEPIFLKLLNHISYKLSVMHDCNNVNFYQKYIHSNIIYVNFYYINDKIFPIITQLLIKALTKHPIEIQHGTIQ